MRRALNVVAVACAALLMGAEGKGCAADREIPVKVVRGGAQCAAAGDQPSAEWIPSADALAAAFPAPLGAGETPPAVDFAKEAVVVVSLGQKPTAGFSVELASPKAPVKDKVAGVIVRVVEPAAGAMTAQVITTPCLAVAFPKDGIAEVKVATADGKVLAGAKAR